MPSIINQYLAKVYTVTSYLLNQEKSEVNRKTILIDTLKCIFIGGAFSTIFRFCRGSCHYLKYFKWIFWGSAFGLAYSFYFTNQKIETFEAKNQLSHKDAKTAEIKRRYIN